MYSLRIHLFSLIVAKKNQSRARVQPHHQVFNALFYPKSEGNISKFENTLDGDSLLVSHSVPLPLKPRLFVHFD